MVLTEPKMYQRIISEHSNIFVHEVFFSVHPNFEFKKGRIDRLKPALSLSLSWTQIYFKMCFLLGSTVLNSFVSVAAATVSSENGPALRRWQQSCAILGGKVWKTVNGAALIPMT